MYYAPLLIGMLLSSLISAENVSQETQYPFTKKVIETYLKNHKTDDFQSQTASSKDGATITKWDSKDDENMVEMRVTIDPHYCKQATERLPETEQHLVIGEKLIEEYLKKQSSILFAYFGRFGLGSIPTDWAALDKAMKCRLKKKNRLGYRPDYEFECNICVPREMFAAIEKQYKKSQTTKPSQPEAIKDPMQDPHSEAAQSQKAAPILAHSES